MLSRNPRTLTLWVRRFGIPRSAVVEETLDALGELVLIARLFSHMLVDKITQSFVAL